MTGRERGGGARVDLLAAALLDDDAGDRRLALGSGEVLAGPAVAPETRGQEIAQQVGLVAVVALAARIADQADAAQRSGLVEQRGDDDRKAVGLGAGILLHLLREIVGLGPILQLVVVAEIDFAQTARLCTAAAKVAEAVERQRRRPAVAAA